MKRVVAFALVVLMAVSLGGALARAEAPALPSAIPQIDSSTARIPITGAIYKLLKDNQLIGPEPICSKTHGAWLNLADGVADILFTVAPTKDEFRYFQDAGVGIEVKVFGYDGLVFIGNGENPVQNLTSGQVRAIYSGAITNWSAVGGDDAPVDAYIRDAESGSQRLFEQLVWAGHDMPDFASLGLQQGEIEKVASAFKGKVYYDMEGIVVDGIAQNKYSIGFNIMSYVDEKFLDSSERVVESASKVRATGELNLRTGPNLKYKSLGSVKAGALLEDLDEEAEDERGVWWYKVRHPEQGEVWVSSRYSEKVPEFASSIKLFGVDGFEPSTENFASGDYPFVTTSIVAIRKDEPEDSPARQLFDWIGSEQSRALIAENSTLAVAFSEPYQYQP